MPVAKLLVTNTQHAMISDEGTGSLDTFIAQDVGKEPLILFSRNGDGPTQWIQLLHTFDQKDLSGWSLLAPMKVQMQKCDKCAREFCSTINYRRHIRVHRRSMNIHKEPQKYKDILGAFWDKLDYDKAKEILSFKDVNLEEVPGSSIVNDIAANLWKLNFLSFPQVHVMAGSALVDNIQGKPSRLPISSQELFSVLDDASERTFLCAGTAESLKKYVFDGEAVKIGLEMKNLIACTSFLVEQILVNAWLADKDAEALRCQKLLVEEEEAAQKRQAEQLERKRQRKILQKEQRTRDQSDGMKIELYTASDIFECDTSAENCSCQTSSAIDSIIPDESTITPLDPVQLPSYEEAIDDSDSNINEQRMNNSSQHFVARWHMEQRINNGAKVWTKKPKPENIAKSKVHDDANNQTAMNSCQLMIGSIAVTVRNRTGQYQVNSPAVEFQESENMEIKTTGVQNLPNHSNAKLWRAQHETRGQSTAGNKSQALEEDATSARGVNQTLTTQSSHHSCESNVNDEATNDCSVQVEGGGKLIPFSIDAAKDFLSQRWKEAISRDHVKLVLTLAPERLDVQGDLEGQLVAIDSSFHANGQV